LKWLKNSLAQNGIARYGEKHPDHAGEVAGHEYHDEYLQRMGIDAVGVEERLQ